MPNLPMRARLTLSLLALVPLLAARADAADDARTGEQIYKSDCARCHGPNGEGTKRHKRRLEGDRSVAQLTSLIHKTMPEDGPGTLTQAEAAAVAAYVHGAFYSALARERNRPARVELARLTVRQYRQA